MNGALKPLGHHDETFTYFFFPIYQSKYALRFKLSSTSWLISSIINFYHAIAQKTMMPNQLPSIVTKVTRDQHSVQHQHTQYFYKNLATL